METITQNISPETQTINGSVNPDSMLHVIYGSRTGNSKAAATLAWEYGKYLGLDCRLHDMKTFVHDKMSQIKNLLIAVSTHGDGDPPAVVEDFYDFIHSDSAPSMKGVNFSVLALGDSSYKDFCKTGRDFRNRLLELGANEISPLVECDIDYEENAKKWVAASVPVFEKILPTQKRKKGKEFAFEINKRELEQDNAFYARMIDKKLLTAVGSEKRTIHLALSMKNYTTPFHPGDSFGIYTANSRLLVDKLLKALHFDGTRTVPVGNTYKLLKETLVHEYEITLVTPVVLRKYAELAENKKLREFIRDEGKVKQFCEIHDVLDMVTLFPAAISPEAFLSVLRKLSPRLYSVASSSLVFPDELHLTAGVIEYPLNKRKHKGVSSTFFEDRLEIGDSIPVFPEPNEKFRLPADDSVPVIMIATGTGIAPFRGFLQERKKKGASGKNWLFFGDRYLSSDFLYGEEMEDFYQSGVLTNLDLAFSRDQEEKVYVQHCMLEKSKEFFRWVDQLGAVIYLCGNKRTMGIDVKETIQSILAAEGDLTDLQTREYIQRLIKQRRLLTDLY